jgi:hypothetical protein
MKVGMNTVLNYKGHIYVCMCIMYIYIYITYT